MPDQPAPRPTPNWAADFPKLREATDQWLFGDIWERSGLSKRDRSLITVAMLTALYRTSSCPATSTARWTTASPRKSWSR